MHLLLTGVYLAIRGSAMNKRMNPFNGNGGHNCDIEAFIIMMIILIVVFGCVG